LPPPASPDQARTALAAALDAWQRGEPVDTLTGGDPPIHVNDPAVRTGAQLLGYTLAEGHETYGQSVRLTASLSLRLADGTTRVRKASYLIDTSPAVVIVPGWSAANIWPHFEDTVMRLVTHLGLGLAFLAAGAATPAWAQKQKDKDDAFDRETPRVGDALPALTVYTPDGKAFETADLRGHYTVLTFGCLTWPPFLWNVSGLEAAYRDFGPKKVRFYFIYKTLAHPELVGHYVQPITLDERLAHARQAQKQLGATVPWVVDAMDNRLKHALGDRPNSEFIIDPAGKVVRKRAWSHPTRVRKDLEELVGKPARTTREDEVKLNTELPLKAPAARGVVARIARPRMQAVVSEPQIDKQGVPFYAKLRAEADNALLTTGTGKLYLGFHLDPFHQAHWNNLTDPLKYQLDAPEGANVDKPAGESPKGTVASDADPREFVLAVHSWPKDKPLTVTVTYAACIGDTACHVVRQRYVLRRQRDPDGGGARGEGAGFWDADEFARQALAGDKDGDGKLSKAEVRGLILPHFAHFDANKDEVLDVEELKVVAQWLNTHHLPGVPDKTKKWRSG
jgi:hypothetical protein